METSPRGRALVFEDVLNLVEYDHEAQTTVGGRLRGHLDNFFQFWRRIPWAAGQEPWAEQHLAHEAAIPEGSAAPSRLSPAHFLFL